MSLCNTCINIIIIIFFFLKKIPDYFSSRFLIPVEYHNAVFNTCTRQVRKWENAFTENNNNTTKNNKKNISCSCHVAFQCQKDFRFTTEAEREKTWRADLFFGGFGGHPKFCASVYTFQIQKICLYINKHFLNLLINSFVRKLENDYYYYFLNPVLLKHWCRAEVGFDWCGRRPEVLCIYRNKDFNMPRFICVIAWVGSMLVQGCVCVCMWL